MNRHPAEHDSDRGQRIDRYPGANPFADDPVHQRLFFGRQREIASFQHQLVAGRLMVLYGKSGLGKTSLLQAGIFPELRKADLLPLRVRANRTDVDPVAMVIEGIERACQEQGIDYTPGRETSLWEFFKTAVFWQGTLSQTPVLVLDQFEEIFTRQDKDRRQRLAEQLGELLSGGLPRSVRDRASQGGALGYSEKPPALKMVIALRWEYVGRLEELFPEIPSILSHRFLLKPLYRAQAEEAVVEPARLSGDPFTTRPFSYDQETLNRLLAFLEGTDGAIEPFQLQLLCDYIERQVARRQGESELLVDDSYLGGDDQMAKVLENFYLDSVARLPSRKARRAARRLCEELCPEGHREPMGEARILRDFRLRQTDLDRLVELRLLRKEPQLGRFSYELVHDSLIAPVQANRSYRLPKHILYGGGGILLALVLLAGWQTFDAWKSEQLEAMRRDVTAQAYQTLLRKTQGVTEPEMVVVTKGTFLMGSSENDDKASDDEFPRHRVEFTRPFAIGKYEVTFEEYDEFALATRRRLPEDFGWGRGKRPVVNVSWHDAKAYADWLNEQTGKKYRLPSEAEWEYAARAGTQTRYWWGDEVGRNRANCNGCGSQWDNRQTAPAGRFEANAFGLHDTLGNAWEWVQDCSHANYKNAPEDGSAWLEANDGDCNRRVIRGGSWSLKPRYVRSAFRFRFNADVRYNFVGFRLAQDID